jgi:membrane-bound lytic murein transglycosylase B
MPLAPVVLVLLAVLGAAPAAARPIAADPPQSQAAMVAADYAATASALRKAIDRWRESGEPETPPEVTALATHQQVTRERLAERPRLWRQVLERLGPTNRADLRDDVAAKRELASIHSVVRQRPKIRIGPAEPADRLMEHYRRAWRRFKVAPRVLAAVNFVESRFGRLRNESVSGARGPMQFMPATWAAYGMGGDVRDPRDAILGAANYLHANGAPRTYKRALYRYNPSSAYVSAVWRYAEMIRRDKRAFYALYARPVIVKRS